ncbi:DUF1064 domain-containing protein [Variovorax sp. DAIF25]|uniref:DUF1064 domain-containing protein n=1 Tax=Variovorax sp. DAIF25 TaxID=3080983 RepID=UPI003D6A09AB
MKYLNKKTVVDGLKFDSMREARRWSLLRTLEKAGRISDLQCQVAFELAPSVRLAGATRPKPPLRYIADFVYIENGARVVEDVKGGETANLAAFRIKLHLMKHLHGIDVRISK